MKRILGFLQVALLMNFNTIAQNAHGDFKAALKGIIPEPVHLAIQPDDKVIVGGSINSAGSTPILNITRLNGNGSLDNSFNKDLRIPGRINDILIEDDGNIVIAGQRLIDQDGIIRLDENGQFDPSFTLDPALVDIGAVKIKRQADGKYIVAAFYKFFRLNEDGSLDKSFNEGNGFSAIGIDDIDIEIQKDNKIVVAGSFSKFNDQDVENVVRLNSDGSIDETFSVGSGAGADNGNPSVKYVEIQSDGKIILAGRFNSFNSTPVNGIVRLNPNGTIDNSFLTPAPAVNTFSHGIIQLDLMANDQIVVCGLNINGSEINYRVIVLTPDGSLNTSFTTSNYLIPRGIGGIYSPAIGINSSQDVIFAGAIESLNGVRRIGAAATDSEGNILEFNPMIGGLAEINALVKQSDGKVVIGGKFLGVDNYQVKNLVRLNQDGTVDETFLNNIGVGADMPVNALEMQNDGKILVGGGFNYFKGEEKRYIVRIEADGIIDNTFNPNIYVPSINDGIVEIHEQANGKIIIAGSLGSIDGTSRHNLGRLNNDGSLDDTFNSANLLNANDQVSTVKFQSDGKILIGGRNIGDANGGFLFRTDADGNNDISFSHTLDLSNTAVTKIGVLDNDDIIIAGYYSKVFPHNQTVPVYQLKKDGALLDEASLTITNGKVKDILFVENDQIILTGEFEKVNGIARHGFAKVSLTGQVSDFDVKIAFNDVGTGGNTINRILKIDEETLLIGGQFNQIRNQTGFSGLAKISLSNSIPQITGSTGSFVTDEDTNVEILLEDLVIADDFFFQDNYTLTVNEGDNYSVANNIVMPDLNYYGTLTVPVAVNDGWDESPVYALTIEITSVNDVPVIKSVRSTIETSEETPFGIALDDLEIVDPDNDNFTLIIAEGEAYTVDGFTITPKPGVNSIEIPLAVNDGIESSELFLLQVKVIMVVGVESDFISGIKVFPNPASDRFNVDFSNKRNASQPLLMTMYDLNGQIISSEGVELFTPLQVDIDRLDKGVYILKFQGNKATRMFRLTKE